MEQPRILDAIIAVCCTILGDDEILGTDNFFALGGTSLDAIFLIETLLSQFGVVASLDDVFEAEDIRSLAQLCVQATTVDG